MTDDVTQQVFLQVFSKLDQSTPLPVHALAGKR